MSRPGHDIQSTNSKVMEHAIILRIAGAKMTQVLQEEPSFSELFLKYVLSHSLRVEEDLVVHF